MATQKAIKAAIQAMGLTARVTDGEWRISVAPTVIQSVYPISHGAAIRLSELNKRAFLAREKVRSFEEKYAVKLPEIEKTGLPDDAGYEMHEDYIMCSHWSDVIEKTEKQIELLRPLLEYGVLR